MLFILRFAFVIQLAGLPPELQVALDATLTPGLRHAELPSASAIRALETGLVDPDPQNSAWSATGLAWMLVRAGMTPEVQPLVEQAERVFLAGNDLQGLGHLCLIRGYAAYVDGDLFSAFSNLTEAATYFDQAVDSVLAAWVKADMIRVALDSGMERSAEKLLTEFDQAHSDDIHPRIRVDIGISRARIAAGHGDPAKAILFLEQVLGVARYLEDVVSESEISLLLSSLYLETNRPRQSAKLLEAYMRLINDADERTKQALHRTVAQSVKSKATKPPTESLAVGWVLFMALPITTILMILAVAVGYMLKYNHATTPQSPELAVEADLVEVDLKTGFLHAQEQGHETDPESEIEHDKLAVLYQRVIDLFENEALYRMPRLTLSDVAYRLGTNDKYVSQAVNTRTGGSFIHLLNEYRIRHAKMMLNKYGRRASSRRVAIESGFGSVSSLHRVFKAHTGLTPVEWIRDPAARRAEAERSDVPA